MNNLTENLNLIKSTCENYTVCIDCPLENICINSTHLSPYEWDLTKINGFYCELTNRYVNAKICKKCKNLYDRKLQCCELLKNSKL